MPCFDLNIFPELLWNCGTFDSKPKPAGIISFTCLDLSTALGSALTIKITPQCWAYTLALQKREKSKSQLFTSPYPWLQVTVHNTFDHIMNFNEGTENFDVYGLRHPFKIDCITAQKGLFH